MNDRAKAGSPIEHYVNPAPFDPHRIERMTPEMERYYMAPQWRLVWWKFRRHRLAVVSGLFLLVMYLSILMSEVLAPYNLHSRHVASIYAPPQSLHLFHDGRFVGSVSSWALRSADWRATTAAGSTTLSSAASRWSARFRRSPCGWRSRRSCR
jgi:hypothetical protein